MKNPFIFVLTALLVAAMVPIASNADDLSAQQSAIDAVYKTQCAAVVAGDTGAWSNTLTPDYVQTDPDGTVDDLDKAVAEIKGGLAQLTFSSCTDAISAIQQSGDNMIVTVAITLDGTAVANSAPAEVVSNQVDTWTNAGGTWAQKADFTTEQKVTIDGKVVQDLTSTGTPPR